jgi:hypothetical protein
MTEQNVTAIQTLITTHSVRRRMTKHETRYNVIIRFLLAGLFLTRDVNSSCNLTVLEIWNIWTWPPDLIRKKRNKSTSHLSLFNMQFIRSLPTKAFCSTKYNTGHLEISTELKYYLYEATRYNVVFLFMGSTQPPIQWVPGALSTLVK